MIPEYGYLKDLIDIFRYLRGKAKCMNMNGEQGRSNKPRIATIHCPVSQQPSSYFQMHKVCSILFLMNWEVEIKSWKNMSRQSPQLLGYLQHKNPLKFEVLFLLSPMYRDLPQLYRFSAYWPKSMSALISSWYQIKYSGVLSCATLI